jgi:hypothetical protein
VKGQKTAYYPWQLVSLVEYNQEINPAISILKKVRNTLIKESTTAHAYVPFCLRCYAVTPPKSDENDGGRGPQKTPREIQKKEWEPLRQGEKASTRY